MKLTPETARALLADEDQKKIKECSKEVEDVLAKHNCAIDVAMVIRSGSITPQIQIVLKKT